MLRFRSNDDVINGDLRKTLASVDPCNDTIDLGQHLRRHDLVGRTLPIKSTLAQRHHRIGPSRRLGQIMQHTDDDLAVRGQPACDSITVT